MIQGHIAKLQAAKENSNLQNIRTYVDGIRKEHSIKGESDITLEYLKELWEQQGGLCPFTGWELLLPKGSSYSGDPGSMYRASIDRLDNSKGYVIGNIRFISVIANYCRNTFTDDQVRLFCESVHKHTGTI